MKSQSIWYDICYICRVSIQQYKVFINHTFDTNTRMHLNDDVKTRLSGLIADRH